MANLKRRLLQPLQLELPSINTTHYSSGEYSMALATPIPYRGGFFLGPGSPAELAHAPIEGAWHERWHKRQLSSYELCFDPTFPCTSAASGDTTILCLGYIVNVYDPAEPHETIERLAKALSESSDVFYRLLGDCAGAYVLFCSNRGKIDILLDATGTVGVCYTKVDGQIVVGSHPNLLAEVFGFHLSELADFWLNHPALDKGGRYFPGLRTAFDDVRVLTPNTMLRIPDGKISRYYPEQELPELTVEEIVEEVVPVLSRQANWIAQRANLAVSLSGGLDTRVTLSALRSVAPNCLFFTYSIWGNPILKTDLEVGTTITEVLGLRHLPIVVEREFPPAETFVDIWRRTNGGSQGNQELVEAYCKALGGQYLHVRSNILEVARGFYTKNAVNRTNQFDAYKLSRLFRNATAREFESYFDEFIEVTDFRTSMMHGKHYTDLFYWEHRLGTWLSGLLRAARADHQTYILFNCRSLIEKLSARPLENRNSAEVMFEIIRAMWPETLEFPIFSGAKFISLPSGVAPQGSVEETPSTFGDRPDQIERQS